MEPQKTIDADAVAAFIHSVQEAVKDMSHDMRTNMGRINHIISSFSHEITDDLTPDDDEPTGLAITLPFYMKCSADRGPAVRRAFERYGINESIFNKLKDDLYAMY